MRLVKSFLAALNQGDSEAAAKLCAPDARFNDSMFESVRSADAIADLIGRLSEAGVDLQIEAESVSAHGHLVLMRGTMRSEDPRFCGPLQMTFTIRGRLIGVIDSHRGADAASVVRIYGEPRRAMAG